MTYGLYWLGDAQHPEGEWCKQSDDRDSDDMESNNLEYLENIKTIFWVNWAKKVIVKERTPANTKKWGIWYDEGKRYVGTFGSLNVAYQAAQSYYKYCSVSNDYEIREIE